MNGTSRGLSGPTEMGPNRAPDARRRLIQLWLAVLTTLAMVSAPFASAVGASSTKSAPMTMFTSYDNSSFPAGLAAGTSIVFTAQQDIGNGTITTTIPAGFSPPPVMPGPVPGAVSIVHFGGIGDCTGGAVSSITGTGPWTVTVNGFSCGIGQTVGLFYASNQIPTVVGTYVFTPNTVKTSPSATPVTINSATVTVVAGPVAKFVASGTPSTTAGAKWSFDLAAADQYGNTVTGYTGTVHFTSTDPQAQLPSDVTFKPSNNGISKGLSAVFKTAIPGGDTLTTTDAANSLLAGHSKVNVMPGATSGFAMAPYFSQPCQAGQPCLFSATAKDSFGNTTPAYTGTVTFSATDTNPLAVLPKNYTFTSGPGLDNGSRIFVATLVSSGNQSVTVTDLAHRSIAGSVTLPISPLAATSIAVSGFPSPTTAGLPKTFHVVAKDQYGNPATGYAGTVHFSSSDHRAVLPADSQLSSGSGTFSAMFGSAGSQSITATDTVTSTITGSQTGITVHPAALTITASNATMQSGGPLPVVTPIYTGLLPGDTAPSTPPTCVAQLSTNTTVCSGASDPNYNITYVSGTLTVTGTPAPLTAVVTGTQTYGSQTPTFTATYQGLVNGDTPSVVTGTLTCSTTATSSSPVGSGYSISNCSGLSAPNYNITYSYGAFTVTPAPLNLSVSGTQMYGASPLYSVTNYVGLVNGDSTSVVTGTLSCSTNATAKSPIGTGYTVSACSGLSAPNYSISYSPGSLSVTPAPLTVSVSGTQVYGGSPSYSITNIAGLVNGDPQSVVVGSLSCSTTAKTSSSAGNGYFVSACSGLTAPNYTISYSYGAFTVTAAPLNLSVSGTQVYGASPLYSITNYVTLVNGDSTSVVSGTLSCATNASATSPVASNYTISGCSGLSAPNYSISYTPGSLSVTPAPLTVSVSGTQVYGGTPSYSITHVAGLVNNESSSLVSGTPSCSTNAVATSPVASNYTISGCSGLSAPNYSISYTPGSLSVTPAPLTVSVSGTQVYGGTPSYSITHVAGLVNNESSSLVSGTPSCATNAVATSPVASNYTISGCSGLSAPNYSISYTPGSLSVTPAPLTVSVSGTQVYGSSPLYNETNIAGLVNNESTSLVTGQLSCSTSATATSPVASTYTISGCSGLSAPNYSISYTPGSLSVTPAPATVTADDKTMTDGSAQPAYTYTPSGLVGSDTLSSITCAPTSTVAGPGSYTIACSQPAGANPNYDITFRSGTLTVLSSTGATPVTVTADDQSMTYGGTQPTYTYHTTPTETLSGITCAPTTTVAGAGKYTIACSGNPSANPAFVVTFVNGTLTVGKAPLTLTPAGTQVYGGSPQYTITNYGSLLNGDPTSVVSGTLTCSTNATAASHVGTSYTVTGCSGLTAANYSISYGPGSLSVTPAPLTLTPAGTQVYGSSPHYTITSYGTLLNGDPTSVVSGTLACSTNALTGSAVGNSYTVSGCGGLTAGDYSISYAAGSLTVTPAPLNLTVIGTQVYGASPVFSVTNYVTLVNNDPQSVVSGTLACSTSATVSSGVGSSYTISGCSGLNASNYNISYTYGHLTVTPAPLTATVDGTEVFGLAQPVFTATYAPLVNQDPPSVVTGTLACSTNASEESPVADTYTISGCSGLSAANYTISYSYNHLSVTASKVWTGGGTAGDWNDPTNWTPAGVPGSGDVVWIPAGAEQVTYSNGVSTSIVRIGTASTNGLVIPANQGLTLTGPGESTITALNLTGNLAVASTQTLDLEGSSVLGGGTVDGPGSLNVDNGAQVSWSGTVIDTQEDLVIGSGGTLSWDSAGGPGCLNGGSLSVYGTFEVPAADDGQHLGNCNPNVAPGVVTVEAGGVFDRSGTAGTTTIVDIALDNFGTVETHAGAGSLQLNAGNSASAVSDSGGWVAGDGGEIFFAGGSRSESSSATFTGAGSFEAGAGVAFPSSATTDVPNLVISGAGAVSGDVRVTSALTGSGGQFGPGTLAVASAVNNSWSGTAILAGGLLQVGSPADTTAVLSWDSPGGIPGCLDGGSLSVYGTFQVPVAADGAQLGDCDPNAAPGAVTVEAHGVFERSGTAGTTTSVNIALDNFGTVETDAGAGNLQLVGGNSAAAVSDSGAWIAGNGGEFFFSGGSRSESSSATFAGPGIFELNGGSVAFPSSAATNVPNLAISTGSVSGDVTVTSALTGSGGQFGPGTLAVVSASNNSWIGTHVLTGGLLQVGSPTDTTAVLPWNSAGGPGCLDGGSLSVYGTFQIPSADDGQHLGNCDPNATPGVVTVQAHGVFERSGTPGQTAVVDVALDNFGTVKTDDGTGSLQLSAGNSTSTASDSGGWVAGAGGEILFAGGSRSETSSATFTGSGAFGVSGGTVAFPSSAATDVPNLVISGSGVVTGDVRVTSALTGTAGQFGPGTLEVSSATNNSLTGTQILTGGVLQVGSPTNSTAVLSWDSVGSSGCLNGGSLSVYGTFQIPVADDGQHLGNCDPNQVPGVVTVQAHGVIDRSGTAGQTAYVDIALDNFGTVKTDDTTGRLQLSAGNTASTVSDSGAWIAGSGGEILFAGGSRSESSSATFTGSGAFEVAAGTVAFPSSAATDVPNLVISGSGVVSGDVTVTSALTGTAGQFGPGTLEVSSTANNSLTGTQVLTGGVLQVGSPTNSTAVLSWDSVGSSGCLNGGSLSVYGTFQIPVADDGQHLGNCDPNATPGAVTVQAHGVIERSGTAGQPAYIDIRVDDLGEIWLNSGDLQVTGDLTQEGGKIWLQSGNLTAGGTFTEQAAGTTQPVLEVTVDGSTSTSTKLLLPGTGPAALAGDTVVDEAGTVNACTTFTVVDATAGGYTGTLAAPTGYDIALNSPTVTVTKQGPSACP